MKSLLPTIAATFLAITSAQAVQSMGPGPYGYGYGYGYAPQGYRMPAYAMPRYYGYPPAGTAQPIYYPGPRYPYYGAPATAPVRQPATVREQAPPEPPAAQPAVGESTRTQARDDLETLLHYRLDGASVPRIEIPRLPANYGKADDPEQRKAMFLRMLLPLVLMENESLARTRHRMLSLLKNVESGAALSNNQKGWLRSLAGKYRVADDPITDPGARRMLRRRVDVLPVSLALAQAANESAWGKSRFAREGSNLFGIWTYDESEGMVPRKRTTGKKHLVRKFDSLRESVRFYMHTLNSHPAYDKLRDIRSRQRAQGLPLKGEALANGLEKYSARGEEYVRLIRGIIEHNDLGSLEGVKLADAG